MKSFKERAAWILSNIDHQKVNSFESRFADRYIKHCETQGYISLASCRHSWCRQLSQDLSKLARQGHIYQMRRLDRDGSFMEYSL